MAYSIVGADGREYGPVEVNVLVQWAQEGRVVTRTSILDHDTGRRFLACDLPELAAIFNPPVPGGLPSPYPSGPVAPPYVSGAPVLYDARPRKSRLAAGMLGILLGGFGAHRFYLGYTAIGVLQLVVSFVTCGFGAVWGLVEGIIILCGGMTDADGRPLGD